MSAQTRPAPRRLLRVFVESTDPARRARLIAMVEEAGHAVVVSASFADAVLSVGDLKQTTELPIVTLGGRDADQAGRLPQDAELAQIDAALRAVAVGLVVRIPGHADEGFEALPEHGSSLLTPREIDVLSAIGDGLGNKAIARRLDISLHTVKFHIESIFRKLEVRSRAEAVARGLQFLDL